MIQFKVRELAGGSKQTIFRLFGICLWSCLVGKYCGWFRFFGVGLTWTHNSIPPMFSERIGKRKKITVGNYRYGII